MGKKILVVDDEFHIRFLLVETMEIFENKGVTILTAEDGVQGLKAIQTERPELVFLDIMMPGMDGFDLCNKVKKVLSLENIYICMLTSKGQELDEKRGIACGADKYITKPFSPDAIVKIASEVLGITV